MMHGPINIRTMKFFTMWVCAFGIPERLIPFTGKLKTGEPIQPQRTQQPGAQSANNGPRK